MNEDDLDIDRKLDEIFSNVDSLLSSGRFDKINQVDFILKTLSIESEPIEVLIGYLTICFAARDKLNEYKLFKDKVEKRIVEVYSQKKADKLLKGL